MPAVSSYACALVTAAMIVSANSACAQETRLKVPKVIVVAEAAPGEPPYLRDPAKAYARNPYFGRYRVEEDKFAEVPCTQTRIASSAGGKCLQGYRLVPGTVLFAQRGGLRCDTALDVVMYRVAVCRSKPAH